MRPTLSEIPPGKGRVFVYLKEGGPNILNTKGATDYCTVDEYGYEIMGKTFWYLDLPIGSHTITATDAVNFWTSRPKYGKKKLEFDLSEGETVFVRMNTGGTTALEVTMTYTPVIVSSEEAELEIANLDYYRKFETGKTVKK